MITKIISFLKTKTGIILLIVLLAIIGISIFTLGNGESQLAAFTVERRNISEEVSVSGRVEAAVDVDLSFERSGQISRIYLKVGDLVSEGQQIISLENSSQLAKLAQAEADLQLEKIKLQELRGGSSGVTSSENDLRLAELDLQNAKEDLTREIREAIIETNDAVKNYSDRIFSGTSGKSFGTTITSGSVTYHVDTSNSEKKINVNNGRSKAERIFEDWAELDIEGEPDESANKVIEDLGEIQDFLNDLADLTNNLSEPDDSTIKTAFNNLKDNVSTARTKVNSALADLRSVLQTYSIEQTDLEYVSSQTSPGGEDTRLQEARVASAEAKVAAELASLNQGIIRSPVNGKVTSIKTRIGEVVDGNEPVVTVVSDALYEIVINIPEADISKVELGNEAQITLDAYSENDLFYAKVISIDLSETVVDGVATYEAKLQFNEEDPRIRSGMTANVDISGEERENVLAVPQKAISLKDGSRIVKVIKGEEVVEVPVETGISSDGYVEIISGLEEGQEIVTEN